MNSRRNLKSTARAEEALRRSHLVDAPGLIQLIHEVNPSGRELSPAEEQRRYRLKSQLQSLLIRRFREHLDVERLDAIDVVGLRYRPHDRDACHAVVSELDEDARAWVRLMLDLGASADPEAPRAESKQKGGLSRGARTLQESSNVDSVLARGRDALAAYDFDAARAHFTEAFELDGGSPKTALALLELLVEQLAWYENALELAEKLSEEGEADPQVQALLALGAARAGRADEAERFLKRASGPRAAQALIELARAGLRAGDLKEAQRYLEQTKAQDPAQPEVLGLSGEVAALRALRRKPLEEELERIAASGDPSAVEPQARALLKEWPDSATARRILREIENRRREETAQLRRIEGEKEFESGNYQRAFQLFVQAQTLGATGLEDLIALADLGVAELRERARVENTARQLQTEGRESALLAYLDLPEPLRAQVRARVQSNPALFRGVGAQCSWLDLLNPPRAEASAAAAAVIALGRALEMEPQRDASAILALLGSHESTLQRLEPARALLKTAKQQRELEQERRAQQILERARQALEQADPAQALALLASAGDLPASRRSEAAVLASDAARARDEQRREKQFKELVAARSWLEAWNVALPGRETVWSERRATIQKRLQEQFRINTFQAGGPLPCDFLAADFLPQEPLCCLSSEGDRLYLATVYRRGVFIRVLNIRSQEVERAVGLRIPEAMLVCRIQHDGDSLCIVSNTGAVLELSTTTWDLLSWYPAPITREPAHRSAAWLVPKTRFLWIGYQPKEDEPARIRVVDLAQNRLHREFDGVILAGLVPSEPLSQVLVLDLPHTRLYPPNGSHPATFPLGIRSMAQRPDGAGVFALSINVPRQEIELSLRQPDVLDESLDTYEQELLGINRHTVQGAVNDERYVLASSRQSEHAYLLFSDRHRARWLAAFQVQKEEVVERFRLQVPFGTALAQDVSGKRVALIAPMERSARVIILGSEPPSLGSGFQDRPLPEVSQTYFRFSCGRREEDKVWQDEARRAATQRSAVAAKRFVAEFVRAHEQDNDALLAFADALTDEHEFDLESEVMRVSEKKYSHLASTQLYGAEVFIGVGAWSEGLNRLQSEGSLTGRRLCHFHHLRGVALFKLGHYGDAAQEFSAAAAVVEGDCEVGPWAEMTSALFLAGRPSPGEKDTLSHQYIRRLSLADRHLDRGEGAKAFEMLDCALVWSARDLQALARLAQAMLIQSDESGFLKRLALECFLRVFEQRGSRHQARLQSLADRANEWLEGS